MSTVCECIKLIAACVKEKAWRRAAGIAVAGFLFPAAAGCAATLPDLGHPFFCNYLVSNMIVALPVCLPVSIGIMILSVCLYGYMRKKNSNEVYCFPKDIYSCEKTRRCVNL